MHGYDSERRARDARHRLARDVLEMRAGRVTPNGGVYLQMHHLGADNVRRQFKGMVDRCADCGFDLAGGRVEVVPTAHYMMGGLMFDADCSTALNGLFAAGEDTGGVHGANRLGGNGVANSTVFGGIAANDGAWVRANSEWRVPNMVAGRARDDGQRGAVSRRSGKYLKACAKQLLDACGTTSASCARASGCSERSAPERARCRARSHRRSRCGARLQSELARLAQLKSLIACRASSRRGARARELARRALSRGFSGRPATSRPLRSPWRASAAGPSTSDTSACSSRGIKPGASWSSKCRFQGSSDWRQLCPPGS
jgi:aspartate oxidase